MNLCSEFDVSHPRVKGDPGATQWAATILTWEYCFPIFNDFRVFPMGMQGVGIPLQNEAPFRLTGVRVLPVVMSSIEVMGSTMCTINGKAFDCRIPSIVQRTGSGSHVRPSAPNSSVEHVHTLRILVT